MKSDSATNIKNSFSAYLERVKRGEVVLVLEYGRPVAQISRPVLPQNSDFGLAHLEREGLVSMPKSPELDVKGLLSSRKRLPQCTSLLKALQADREESR